MHLRTLLVQRDLPIGSVLAAVTTGAYNNGTAFFGCTTAWTYRWEMSLFSTLTAGRIAASSIANQFYTADINLTGNNVITPVACSVNNPSIQVPMGNILKSRFSGAGSSVGDTRFAIDLDCDAGTKVTLTLDGSAVSSSANRVLALTNATAADTAAGVGIQMLYNDAPVTLGSALSIGTPTTAGTYSIPLTARYYQTGSTVTAGTANGTATFTLTYQ
ncbi:fimbrial protein [Serratia quinivorans]|uniref:fimbrial protein n=1 Tax=Serratia quinivorans TaxID=137545 RepID=UPI00217ACD20|nr:fimbrial protein [Serratia quinivorans]CAI1072360.1 S-fimbrillin [Serratia quinivorans]